MKPPNHLSGDPRGDQRLDTTRRSILLAFALSAACVLASPAFAQGVDRAAALRLTELSSQFQGWLDAHRPPLYYDILSGRDPAWAELLALPDVHLMYIDDDGRPVVYKSFNLTSAQTISTDEAWPGGATGYNLTGNGTAGNQFGIWDGGAVRTTHQELTGRVTQIDAPGTISNHSTHVAGTLAATGVTANAQGMSFQANLNAWDFQNDNVEMTAAAAAGMLVSNHSYGSISGWDFPQGQTPRWWGDVDVSTNEDFKFGLYTADVQQWDQLAVTAPNYLIVKSAGNDRNDFAPAAGTSHMHMDGGSFVTSTDTHPSDPQGTGFDTVPTNGVAKNILTVGAVNGIAGGYTGPGSVVQSAFSGWGPTDDGRIKPDIVADGVNLNSSTGTGDAAYTTMSGTSMASPSVAGSVNLLRRQFELANTAQPRSATLKALVIQTADEAGANPGPDYANGWGLMNTAAAARVIAGDHTVSGIVEATLANAATNNHTFTLTTAAAFVRATAVWTDPAGTPPATAVDPVAAMLVNDLDIRLVHVPTLATTSPWVLNPAAPANAATTGDNTRDNVEQVHLANAPAGQYRVTVTHKGALNGGTQAYSLVFVVGNQAPIANAGLDRTVECAGATTAVKLDGTGSSDPDNDVLTYSWSATGITFDDATSATPTGQFPLGTTTVTLTVTDPSGASDTDEVDVTVGDTQPPTITVELDPNELWPPNHKLVAIHATVVATDVCDQDVDVILLSVTSNEAEPSPGNGNTAPDIVAATLGTEDYDFELRSERSGGGTGRTYTVCYRATDESGNSATTCSEVVVPRDRSGHATLAQNARTLVIYGDESVDARQMHPAALELGSDEFERLSLGGSPIEHRDLDRDGHVEALVSLDPSQADWLTLRAGKGDDLFARWETGSGIGVLAELQSRVVGMSQAGAALGTEREAIPDRASVFVPNPVAGAIVIRCGLPASGPVRVRIFDMAGREVASMDEGVRSAGFHHLRVVPARPLAPQIYLYRVEALDQVFRGRFTLLR